MCGSWWHRCLVQAVNITVFRDNRLQYDRNYRRSDLHFSSLAQLIAPHTIYMRVLPLSKITVILTYQLIGKGDYISLFYLNSIVLTLNDTADAAIISIY